MPIRRSKPLKRKTALKRTPLARMSPEKLVWMEKYRASIIDDCGRTQQCSKTGELSLGFTFKLERHHPFGRHGKYLLVYCYVTKAVHSWIHDHASLARVDGWLQPPFSGQPYDPDSKRPWLPGTLKNEHLLES